MKSLYDISVSSITGQQIPLSSYQGKALLIVNTASECGFTPQYRGLQELYTQYQAKGLVVLGFPSNDYGAQEPGSDQQIQQFCDLKFKVSFPMFAKGPVKGPSKQPLYAWLVAQASPQAEVAWNFEKFLVGKDGKLAGRFSSKVEPMSSELKAAIEKALA